MIVDCAHYCAGARQGGVLSIAEAGEVVRGVRAGEPADGFVWLGLRTPSHEEMAEVCRAFGFQVDIDELLSPHRRAVLSRSGNLSVLHLRTAEYDDAAEEVTVGELTLVAEPRFLVTIRYGDASPLSHARGELEHQPDLLDEGVTSAVVTVVGAVIESYRPALDGFEKDAVEVEREVLSESRQRPVRRLLNLSRQVRELHLAVEAMEEPLVQLARHRHLGWTGATLDELRLSISLVQRVVARTESLAGLLASAHSANMAQVSAQQNDDMRRISAWVAIAAVPTMIAGIYGMNFDSMPELRSRWGYPIVLAVMVTACVLLYRSFRRRGWL